MLEFLWVRIGEVLVYACHDKKKEKIIIVVQPFFVANIFLDKPFCLLDETDKIPHTLFVCICTSKTPYGHALSTRPLISVSNM